MIADSQYTTVTRTTPGDALKALALSTMSQLAYAGQSSLSIKQKVVHEVPCYYLHLGRDLADIPGVIAELLRER
jgi:hypothetical protein